MQILDKATTLQRLQGWLSKTIPGATDMKVAPIDISFGAGSSAEIFLIQADYKTPGGAQSKELVVRRQADTYELVLGGDLTLQSRMMSALNKHSDLSVPEMIGMEADPALLGAPFLVMVRAKGRIAKQSPNYNKVGWLTEFTPEQRLFTFKNALESVAELHKLDWRNGFTFLDNPKRGAPGLDQYLGWLTEWFEWAAKSRKQPVCDAALDYILKNRPKNATTSVIWGDPTPANTMFNDDGSIAALIDWELAALGPGELDLSWWLYFDDLFSTHFGVERLPGLPNRAATVSIYENAAGRKVENLEYYDVISGLRMAIIALRSADRHIGLGNIKADNKSVTDNLQTQHLARLLGLKEPELGQDFHDFMSFSLPQKKE